MNVETLRSLLYRYRDSPDLLLEAYRLGCRDERAAAKTRAHMAHGSTSTVASTTIIIDGKRYNTAKCEELGHYDQRKCSLSSITGQAMRDATGTVRLLRASNGQLLICSTLDYPDRVERQVCPWDPREYLLGLFKMTAEQEQRCIDLGILEIIE